MCFEETIGFCLYVCLNWKLKQTKLIFKKLLQSLHSVLGKCSALLLSKYHVLPCIMRTHIFGPNFQEKNLF